MTLNHSDIDDVISRSTFHSLLKAAKAAGRALAASAEGERPDALLVVTEAGQTSVYDMESALKLADTFAQVVGIPALVVQLISVSVPPRSEKAEPKAEGE